MHFQQYYLDCLAHASYMIGDERTRTAIVVDPQRDVAHYLADAKHKGLKIKHVFLTHFHADFVAGHLEIQKETGATIHLGARAEAEFEFEPMADESTLKVGDVLIRTMETPGHTPEGISLVIYNLASDPEHPHAVLTGDTLFIGDVGRPDLMASVGMTAEQLAGSLYDSLHNKLLQLPDETRVYPAHGAGSMCGKSLSQERSSTIGAQRATNYALQPMERDAFIRLVTADQPTAPAYFAYDAAMNKKQRADLSDSLAEISALTLDEVKAQVAAGSVQLLDTRRPDDFAAGHMTGSINIELEGRFATWAGTLLTPGDEIILICDPGTEQEACTRLGRIGFDRVAGYLENGVHALQEVNASLEGYERFTADTLEKAMHDENLFLLDVRTRSEHEAGHIPGAVNIPLNELKARIAEVPADDHVVTTCLSGSRSSMAAGLLRTAGLKQVVDQAGGFTAWQEGGKTVESADAAE